VEPTELYLLFGERVKTARESAKLTQQMLATKVGLSRASVANIEAGRQRIVLHQAIQIAGALSLDSIAELLPTDLIQPSPKMGPNEQVKFNGAHLSIREADAIRSIVASS
jgi:DNA-binding XRE family transcriptional regulator